MFTPYRLRQMAVVNRIAMAPMDMYRAVDGTPGEFHIVHLGSRATGGAGLIFTEMTCVSPEGRITEGCTGMYNDDPRGPRGGVLSIISMRRARRRSACSLVIRGGKGRPRCRGRGRMCRSTQGEWEVLGPSPHSVSGRGMQTPREMTRDDMDHRSRRSSCAQSTRYAIDAGFDMLEPALRAWVPVVQLHYAGQQSADVMPTAGRSTNRLRYPLEIFTSMRALWPVERPMSVRISATDWAEDGITGDEAVAIAQAFVAAGADIIHVSTGQTSSEEQLGVWADVSDAVQRSDMPNEEARVPTIAVGNITRSGPGEQPSSPRGAPIGMRDHYGRPHLSDPGTGRCTRRQGSSDIAPQQWPVSYYQGRRQ